MAHVLELLHNRYQESVEGDLRETFAGQEGLLYNMLSYQLGWVDEQGMPSSASSGERLYPFLCLLTCESLMGEYRPALPAATAVELVHNYALIHDGVQSGSPNQGHRSSVWWLWGPGQAINAGDGMHGMARMALMRLQDRGLSVSRVLNCMRLLDQSGLTMCEGQHLDLAFQEKLDVGVGSYVTMAAGKSGALIACSMGLGALAATEDNGVVDAFKEWGQNFGIARQARDDLRELQQSAQADSLAVNLLNKKKLLPIVYALETGDLRTKRELGTIYFKRVLEPADVQQITNILNATSAIEFAEGMVGDYCKRAMRSIENVKLSEWGREQLESLCESIVARDR